MTFSAKALQRDSTSVLVQVKTVMKYSRVLVSSIMIVVLSAASSFPAEINLDRLPIAKTKLDFLSLYKTQWELFGLPGKLKQAVDNAFTEQTENLMWGTVRIQLVMNTDNIQEKIQQSAEFKFTADYDKFLAELEDTWGEKLRDNIMDFYKRQNEAMYFELNANPMAQAYLRQDYDRVTEDNGRAVMTRISAELSTKYGSLSVSGAGIVGGGLMILAKKQLQKHVMKILGRKLAGTALGKLAGGAIPVIGWAMMVWSAWDIYSMAAEAEDTIKGKIFEAYNTMYSEEVPLVYWEGMESYVKDAYIFAYESLLSNVSKGESLAENSLVKELSRNLRKSEQRFFADRVAIVQDIADDKGYTLDDVLKLHGEFMRDAKHKDFDNFAAFLMETDELPQVYPPKPKISPNITPAVSPDILPDVKQKSPVKELSRNLTKSEQRFFADRLAILQGIADDKGYTIDDVLKLHGEFMRDAKHKDFDNFAVFLMETDKLPQVYPPKPKISPDITPAVPHDILPDVKQKSPAPKIYEGH